MANTGATGVTGNWTQLKQYEQVPGGMGATTFTGLTGKANAIAYAAPAIIADYLTRADQLKNFEQANPVDPRFAEARRLEATMLVYAAYYGDASSQKRCADLVAQVRADPALSAADRFALASLADFRLLRLQSFASETARLQKFEQTARALITEFPQTPEPYEALLCLAKDCPDDQAAGMAKDLLTMPASTTVKAGAQTLLNRYALVGQSLAMHLVAGLGAKNTPSLPKGSLVILYPWATTNGGSLAIAEEISTGAPAGATIVGINLDTDPAAARKAAAAGALPGLQLYDPAGAQSPLAQDLKLAFDNTVFITNAKGLILSVSSGSDLVAKLAASAQ